MLIAQRTRRDLILAYVVVLAAGWVLAYTFAAIAHRIQHAWLSPAYLLLPINLISFYLMPLSAAGILGIALRVSGWRRTTVIALLLVIAYTTGRLFYWLNVASQVSNQAAMDDLVAARPPAFWAVSLLGFGAFVALATVIFRTFGDVVAITRPYKPLQPPSGTVLGRSDQMDWEAQHEARVARFPAAVREAHKHSSCHRAELLASELCGCFSCMAVYPPNDITDWVDDGQTALCARCGIDSVIGTSSGFPITVDFLEEMNRHFF
jgi:hypothetical protein